MRTIVMWVAVLMLSVMSMSANAQYEGSDQKYREQRKQDRSEMRKWKLYAGLGTIAVFGGIYVVKALMEKNKKGE